MQRKISANFPACAYSTLPLSVEAGAKLRTGVLVRGRHRMPWYLVGTPGQPVWVVPHGGPGSGVSPALWAAFDLSECQVLVWEQRGCGSAHPKKALLQMGWRHLREDMEALRQTLGLERWSVLGGSWGATLALAYLAQYPHRVDRLILRGAFLWDMGDIRRVFAPQLPKGLRPMLGQNHPTDVRALLRQHHQVLHFGEGVSQARATLLWQCLERQAVLGGWQRSLRHQRGPNPAELVDLKRAQRRTIAQLKGQLPAHVPSALLRKQIVQTAVLRARCGWSSGLIFRGLCGELAVTLPVDWLHGAYDGVCRPGAAKRLHDAQNALGLPATWRWVQSAHLSVENDMNVALRQALGVKKSRPDVKPNGGS